MIDAVALFDSLLKSLFESFSPDAKECFSQFENQITPLLKSEEKIDEKFELIFVDFPESNFKYQKIIESLISFASTDPVSILSNICDRFIKELNRADGQTPEILTINLDSPCVSSFYYFHFIHHLNLQILTDLIKIFFIHFPNRQLIQKVVSCGYKLCASSISDFPSINDNSLNSSNATIFSRNIINIKNLGKNNNYTRNKNPINTRLSKLKNQLIETWSIIFHHVSRISMEVITFSLEQYSDYASSGNIFTLVSKVDADSSFIELLLDTVHNCLKHKQITSEMLSSLSSLFLIVKDVNEQVLTDFFTIAWSLKYHPNLKEQAIELICILFNRLPEFRTKAIQFYSSKIYSHANDDRKVQRAARGFLCQIRGDVSKLTIDGENPQFFNSSGKPPNDSFAVIFIKTFFERSNFNMCIRLFGQIIAHLASIDIFTFERIIVPNFIKLDFLSPRFVSMAVALKIMNSEAFLKENLCKSSEKQINDVNLCFKQKIVDSFQQLSPYADDKYMILTKKVYKNLPKIENSDQIAVEFITNNSLKSFRPTEKSPKLSFVDDSNEKQILLQENIENSTTDEKQSETTDSNEQQIKSKNQTSKQSNKFRLFNRQNKSKSKENEMKESNSSSSYDLNEKSSESNSKQTIDKREELSLASIADLIRVISTVADLDVIKNSEITIIIVRFMCHYNKEISSTAKEVFDHFLSIQGALEVIVDQILSHLSSFSEEIAANCLYLLYKIVKILTSNNNNNNNNYGNELDVDSDLLFTKKKLNLDVSVSKDFYHSIEIHAFCSLIYDSPFCRLIAFNILKRLSLMNVGSIYTILRENHSILNDAFNESIFLLKTPQNPSFIIPIIGTISIENACCCRYNDLWLYFFSNIINAFMGMKEEMSSFIVKCSEIVHKIFSNEITNFTRIAAALIYINSFCYESNLSMKTPNSSKENLLNSNKKIVIDFDSDFDIRESQKLKMANFNSLLDLLSSNNIIKKKSLIRILSLLNWRIIERILPELLTLENELYPDLSESLIYLVRHSENFSGVISSIFPFLIKFLKLLQNYFTYLDINGTREIVWDEAHIRLLKPHQELCVNYCILSSMPFKGDQLQIQEHNMPLIFRQVQSKFLFHWSQLPTDIEPEFTKLKTYSSQTLILIINSGPVFIEGFSFDSNFFDLMIKCEKNGDPVLYSLLYYHIDLLLGEFVKNSLIRAKDESRFFIIPIFSILSEYNEPSLFENHIGSLILLSIVLRKEKNKSYMQILSKLDSLFVKKNTFINDSEKKKSKFERYLNNMKYFEFASEQIVEAGLNILQECKNNYNLFKLIVEAIQSIFFNIHFLPNKRLVFQGVPSKYQRFSTVSFFNLMLSISSSLDKEKMESFSILWYNLIQSPDNSSIVLLMLFDHPNSEMKTNIFTNLLIKEPMIITKFLSKRCSFAYWYFMQTQLHQKEITTITWMVPVLTKAFIFFFDSASSYFVNCLHFSLLFIEECGDLFEALLATLRIESVDSEFIWTSEGPRNIIQVAYVISEIASIFSEQNPAEIIQWAEEAVRWSVACNDIKIGYRSLYILRILQTELPQNIFPLFAKAVSYHLSSISKDDEDEDSVNNDEMASKEKEVSLFIGECFEIIHHRMNNSDLVTFAYRFASLFINCQFLDNACLKRAMPIFIACTNNMVLMSMAKKVLVDAFVPYLPEIEINVETQELLAQIADLKTSPELLIVAAAFYRKNLPFAQIDVFDKASSKSKKDENKIKQSHLISSRVQTSSENTQTTENSVNSSSTQSTENRSSAQSIGNTQNSQSTENTQNSQSTENTQNSQSTENTRNSQSTENTQNSQSTENTQNSQSTENTQNSQSTENTQSNENSEKMQIKAENAQAVKDDENKDDDDKEEEEEEESGDASSSFVANQELADRLLSIPLRSSSAHNSMRILGKLLYTSSLELTDSILDVSATLVDRFEDELDINVLIPIFLFAIRNVSSMSGAKHFIKTVGRVNPQIIRVIAEKYSLPFTVVKSNVGDNEYSIDNSEDMDNYYDNENDNDNGNDSNDNDNNNNNNGFEERDVYFNDSLEITRMKRPVRIERNRHECGNLVIYNLNVNMNSNRFLTLNEGTSENRKKLINEIQKDLIDLDENQLESIPITNCKNLLHLNGIIDQKNPPTISPFASQYELVSRVLKEKQDTFKRTSSHSGAMLQLKLANLGIGVSNSSNSGIIACPSTPLLPSIKAKQSNFIPTTVSEKNLKLDLIPIRKINLKMIPSNNEYSFDASQFVVKPKEFLELIE